MAEKEPKTCVIYCRVSSKEQVEGTSLETQERFCRDFAEKQGWEVRSIYIETGESAKTADRTEFTRAINYCTAQKNQVSYFVVYKLDRFSRKTEDHMMVRAVLRKVGTELRSVSEPINESSTGKLMETVMAGFAEFDNNVRTERTKGGMLQRVKEGYWVWASPIGYYKPVRGKRTHIVPDPERAPLVRLAFEEYAKGGRTYKQIAQFLTERGFRTKKDKPIKMQEVQKMLRNPVYCGIIKSFGGEWPGLFESIISKQLFAACQPVPGMSAWTGPRAAENPSYPLRKIVRCSECGKSLTGSAPKGRGGRRYPYYHHSNKECSLSRAIPKADLEKAFMAHLERLMPSSHGLRLFRTIIIDIWKEGHQSFDRQNAAIRQRIAALETDRQQIFELHRRGVYSDKDFSEQQSLVATRINEQLARIQEQRAEEIDMEALLDRALEFLNDPAKLWREYEGNYLMRIRFQGLIFKAKLPFDGKTFGTTELSPILELKKTSLGEKSLLVVPRGIEPLFTP